MLKHNTLTLWVLRPVLYVLLRDTPDYDGRNVARAVATLDKIEGVRPIVRNIWYYLSFIYDFQWNVLFPTPGTVFFVACDL